MIRYLIDSSGLWRVLRDGAIRSAWSETIAAAAIGSCHPQRTEFRRSARDLDDYERMTEMFADRYPDAPVPKTSWRWIETAQYRLVRAGAHRALSPVDLLVCATAAAHRLVVLHDDGDFAAAARLLDDIRERRIQDVPGAM